VLPAHAITVAAGAAHDLEHLAPAPGPADPRPFEHHVVTDMRFHDHLLGLSSTPVLDP
jgi:hypothetical protein